MKRFALALVLVFLVLPWARLSTLDSRPSILISLAQGEIRVTSQSYENRFPKEIAFQLKAEGDQDIKTITFFYRVGSGRSTSYAYPSFNPGRTVEASYVLPTAGARYVVPGSELEYYYEIEAAGGAKLKTQPVKLTYEDTRFTWQKLPGNQVTVYYYGQEGVARRILQVAQDTLAKMAASAGQSMERPVKVYVYASKRDMDVALPFRSETSTRDLITQGEAFSDADLVMILGSDPDVGPTTAHELTHLITDQLTSNPFAGIPAWLNEGLSMFAEGELRAVNQQAVNDAIRRSSLLTLRAASGLPGKPEQVNLFYGEAYSVVRYLIDTYGPQKMSQLLATFKEGTSADQALKKVYGFDVDGLEAQWRAAIGAPPVQGAAQQGPAKPDAVPTIVPFGANQPAPVPASSQAESQTRSAFYVVLAASVVFVSLAFLGGLLLVRRR